MDIKATYLTPLVFSAPDLNPSEQETLRGQTDSGWEVIPLDSPVEEPKLLFQGMQDKVAPTSKETTLLDRIAFPLKASAVRISNAITAGATVGGVGFGAVGAGIGAGIGGGLGACVGGLMKLANMAKGKDSQALKIGAMLGGIVGAVIGGIGTGLPGAVIGAMGFAVVQLVGGVFQLPCDLYYAFTAEKLELPANLFTEALKYLKEASVVLIETVSLLSQPISLKDALDEMQVTAKDLNQKSLKKAYHRRSRQTHPDKGGSEEAFQRVDQANKLLELALNMSTPLEQLAETQEKLRPDTKAKDSSPA